MNATFHDAKQANEAIDELVKLGYRLDEISLFMNHASRNKLLNEHSGTAIGNMVQNDAQKNSDRNGGRSMPIFVAGPPASNVAGEARGEHPPSIQSLLANLGLRHDDAQRMEHDIDAGGIIVGVSFRPDNRAVVQQIMTSHQARNVSETPPSREFAQTRPR
jgi:hypothetical protein